jgi:hypothetical protein
MTQIYYSICDECNNKIQEKNEEWIPKVLQKWTVDYESVGSPSLNNTMHFCSFEHMLEYLNKAHEKIKKIE